MFLAPVLILNNLKLHKKPLPQGSEKLCVEDKFILWLTINPGLADVDPISKQPSPDYNKLP